MLKIVQGLAVASLLCCAAEAATVSGTVKGPDGAPFRGAFVRAENKKANLTVSVLSDKTGRYTVPNLPAGEYTVQIRAAGFRAEPQSGLTLTSNQGRTLDFSLAKDRVRWTDLSLYQTIQLLPKLKGNGAFVGRCLNCHGMQPMMAAGHRNEEGWRSSVDRMRDMARFSMQVPDAEAEEITGYLLQLFGEPSALPESPEQVPGYEKTIIAFPEEAMKITYVEFDMPGPGRMPLDANPARDGSVWIPYFSAFNGIARLDPRTGVVEEYRVPERRPAYIHSVQMAPNGSVWFTEQATNRIGKWDPKTKGITEYQDSFLPGKENQREGGSKQTLRIDSHGVVWGNSLPLTSFDPATEKFTKYFVAENPYGIDIDKDDNVWFADAAPAGRIFRVDARTRQFTSYQPPTAGFPRRLQVAPDGVVWFAEFRADKIGRFDPKTETFTEYSVPGTRPAPSGLGIDKQGYVWYSSELDVMGRFDPKTEEFIQYPLPLSVNAIRELLPDSEGRLWWGSAPNNKVGYFYLAGQ